MKKKFTFLMAAVMLLTIIGLPGNAVGQSTTTYTFSSKSWAASPANWTSGQDGAQMQSGRGVQVTEAATGANATSPSSYNNISQIVVTYSTNASSGAGSIVIQVGSNTAVSKNVTKTGGTTDRTLTWTYSPNQSGSVKLTVNCTKNSIYVKSVAITTAATGTPTTTTINATGINNNIYGGNTNGGSLAASVTVTSGGAAVGGATVSWSSSNTSVATIASDGAVTLNTTGNTTITATYAGNDTYSGSSATYALTVINENPDLETIWSENFSSYSADDVPDGGDYNYECTDGGSTTKIYAATLAGGTSPELLVSKGNGSFSATIPLLTSTYGYEGDLVLTFKSNAYSINVKSGTTGITVDGEATTGAGVTFSSKDTHTVTFEGTTVATENITIVFTANTSDNVRLDDIVLKGIQEELTTVATPVISPASGAVGSGREITITCATEGASIYYTMGENPDDPTESSTLYNSSSKPTITTATTIKAIAIKKDLENSAVASASYTLAAPCATPTFSVASGAVEQGTPVTITTATDGATIYYTTDGSDPTTSSSVYSSALTINTAQTIKAIAAKEDLANSDVASATYTIRDYAILPFVWTGGNTTSGGGKEDLTAITGVTASGLGSDYAQSNAPYRIKFDGAGDYIQIKLDGQPARLTIAVKMLGGATTSKIKVQESATGTSFTDIEELNIEGSSNAVLEFDIANAFSATTRYVKIIKSVHGSNVGVGPIVIYKTSEIAPNTTWTPSDFTPVANNVYVISEGNTLTLNGDFSLIFNDPEILVVEDGGQLKVSSKGVKATFKKTISQSTKGSAWNTISSPVGTVNDVTTVTNLVTGADLQYNLYRYNETKPSGQWEAYDEDDFTTLEKGRGYLYRNNGKEIAFAGEVNTTSATVNLTASNTALPQLKGFNLIGNPFGEDITMDDIDDESFTGGYVITNDGKWSASPVLTIQPCQGFLVQVDNPETITINKPVSKGTTYNKEYIKFIVANSQYEDAAFALFEKGYGLNKINHRNADIPMLYINKDNRDLAIATMSDDTKSFNLNFKAMTMGQYTLSYKATGEYSYLHVIDRFTGEDVDMLLEGEYKFVATPNDNEARFIVKLGYMPDYSDVENDIFAYQNGSEILVSGEGELQIFDVTGRNVMTTMINGAESINIPAKGVYIFRLVGKEIKTQKIVVR